MFGLFKSSSWNVFFVWGMVFFHLRLAFFRVASPTTAEAFKTAAPVKATTSSAPVCPYGLMFPHQTAAAGIKALQMAPRSSLYRPATSSAATSRVSKRTTSPALSPAAMASQLSAGFHTWRHFQVHAASTALGLSASSYADFDTICHRSTPKLRSLRLQSTTIAPEMAYAESKTVAKDATSAAVAVAASSSSSATAVAAVAAAASEKLAKQLADANLEVVTLGLSHHNAKVEVREQLAVPEDQWHAVAQQLAALPAIREAAVLSTCNRFELYLAGPNAYEVMREAMQFLLQRAQQRHQAKLRQAEETGVPAPSVAPLDEATLRRNLFLLAGEDAIWHLLRVAAGLDSLVVGEGQILAQVKKAYEHGITPATATAAPSVAEAAAAPASCGGGGAKGAAPAGKVIARLLNTAVSSGKRVRAETGISKGAVSISSAAAEFTHSRLLSDCGVASGRMSDAKIVVLGAGKMARLLLVHLQSQGVRHVTIINRSLDRVNELAAEFPELHVEARLMTSLYGELVDADVVYPSTASETTIIDPEPLARVVAQRFLRQQQQQQAAKEAVSVTGRGGLHLVDISVPRNVHPDCGRLDGVHAYTVDDLKAVVARNTAKRRREMLEAEGILREEQHKFAQWQQSLSAIPTIAKLQEKAEAYRQEELHKAMKKLSQLSPGDLATVERVTKGIVAKLLHGPMHHLRQSNGALLSHQGSTTSAATTTTTTAAAAAINAAGASASSKVAGAAVASGAKTAALDNATAVAAMMVGGDEASAWSSSATAAAAMMSKMTAMRGGGGGGGGGGCHDATRAAILQVQRAFQLE